MRPGSAPSGALECELVCEVLGLYPSSAYEYEVDEQGWAAAWRCPVLFSDDVARFAALQQLNQQREELAARRNELSERLAAAQREAEEAAHQQARLAEALEQRQRMAPSPLPDTVKAAQRKLAQLANAVEAEASSKGTAEALAPRYGREGTAMTAAIDRVLASGDEGVLGVVAQLATVADNALARLASYVCRSLLPVVVVRDADTRQRIQALLAAQRYAVLPDMLAQTHANPYRGKSGELPAFRHAGERAQALQRAACAGSDPPLAVPLPHVTALVRMKEGEAARVAVGSPGAHDWPAGLCGFLFNLVRPVQHGHRAAVLYGLMGSTLVFETLTDASAYREYVCQRLRGGPMGDLITLDGQRISSKGITSGSSFAVPPSLADMEMRFGCGPSADGAGEAEARRAAMEEWVQLLRERAVADEAAAEAQAAADSAAAKCSGELERVEASIADVDAQLALGELAGGVERGAPSTHKMTKRGRRGQQRSETSPHEDEPAGTRSCGKRYRR